MEEKKNTYFPLYFDMRGKEILIIGGGTIALRRINTLIPFEAKLTCVTKSAGEELWKLEREGKVKVICRECSVEEILYEHSFFEGMLSDNRISEENHQGRPDLVLACTSDEDLNHAIALRCRELGILVNNCSDQSQCDFFFPAIIRTAEDAVIGLNAGGKNHRLVRKLREKIEAFLRKEEAKEENI